MKWDTFNGVNFEAFMVIVKHRAVTAGQKIDAMESKSDGEGGVHARVEWKT